MASLITDRFADLTFDAFRALATAEGLSRFERIGFPDSYRDGHERAIFRDINRKLTNLAKRGQTVFDIGCGCSDLPIFMADTCERQGHTLVYCDSSEMLEHLPNGSSIRKLSGCFPVDISESMDEYVGRVDVILAYSVIQYVFVERSLIDFLDACLCLLAPGGQLLIGDIPNTSRRKRFFASAAGVRLHQSFTGTDEVPDVAFNRIVRGKIDDSVVLSLLERARAAGFDAFVMPQSPELPMANRREDVLIVRP